MVAKEGMHFAERTQNVFGQFCEKWAMNINLTKTREFFRREGCLKENKNGITMEEREVVSCYKYLEIFFTS